MQNYIITDLGFGDGGKGVVVDLLCRQTGADLVVRHNGGGQAAHNVVTPAGLHHTFAQIGSGSFISSVRTLLSRYMLVNPLTYLNEADVFESKGHKLGHRVYVDERAPVTTPYHMFLNRAKEYARGAARHGTTGMGISETVLDQMARPHVAMTCADLIGPETRILGKLLATRDALMPDMARMGAKADFERIDATYIVKQFVQFRKRVGILSEHAVWELMQEAERGIVFEGAQGVLLDQDFGFHPHTTWSKTTSANAMQLMTENGLGPNAQRIGVTRSYSTRHGPGPMPYENYHLRFPEPYNGDNGMAGQFRQGWLSVPLLKYAIMCNGGIDGLVVNHLDCKPEKFCLGNPELCFAQPRGRMDQEALCRRAWADADPKYLVDIPEDKEFGEALAKALGTPLIATGHGPSANEKKVHVDL